MPCAALLRRTVVHAVAAGLLVVAIGTLTTEAASASTPDAVVHAAVPSIGVIPDSANGCAGAVCIYVTGTGLHVSDWATSVFLSKSMCSTASFLVNGVLYASGVPECGSANDELVSDWSDPGNFPNGSVLCNTWSGVSGKPCETVHS
jgi:hypothetical protein